MFSTHGMWVMADRWHRCCVMCGGGWLRWDCLSFCESDNSVFHGLFVSLVLMQVLVLRGDRVGEYGGSVW